MLTNFRFVSGEFAWESLVVRHANSTLLETRVRTWTLRAVAASRNYSHVYKLHRTYLEEWENCVTRLATSFRGIAISCE